MESRVSGPKDSGFRNLGEFYPFYLSEHRHPVSRVLHYVGTWGAVSCLLALFATGELWWLLGALACGYSFAWFGHFLFEHNRPATFRHPVYSLASDFRMWWELNLGRLKFWERTPRRRGTQGDPPPAGARPAAVPRAVPRQDAHRADRADVRR